MKVSTRLLRWYDKHQRILPWRKTKDPYKILVSEIMLQQTQVDRVKGYYAEWLKKYPTWKALAIASNAEVVKQWSGLGYNRRALALRDIARQVVKKGVPQTREEWVQLKGIGPYTSAAIALFAQGEKVFPVDSIIRRVMGRIYLAEYFPKADLDEKIEQKGMKILQETKRYQEIPQALFDLGSKICSKAPECTICPLNNVCKSAKGFLSGQVIIPKRSLPKANERVHRNKKFPDRIYRGRILKVVMGAKRGILKREIIQHVDPDHDSKEDAKWIDAILKRLLKDELIECKKNRYYLKQ